MEPMPTFPKTTECTSATQTWVNSTATVALAIFDLVRWIAARLLGASGDAAMRAGAYARALWLPRLARRLALLPPGVRPPAAAGRPAQTGPPFTVCAEEPGSPPAAHP